MSDLSELSDDQLRELLTTSRQTLNSLVMNLTNHPDLQNAITRLLEPDDMLNAFYELASAGHQIPTALQCWLPNE